MYRRGCARGQKIPRHPFPSDGTEYEVRCAVVGLSDASPIFSSALLTPALFDVVLPAANSLYTRTSSGRLQNTRCCSACWWGPACSCCVWGSSLSPSQPLGERDTLLLGWGVCCFLGVCVLLSVQDRVRYFRPKAHVRTLSCEALTAIQPPNASFVSPTA